MFARPGARKALSPGGGGLPLPSGPTFGASGVNLFPPSFLPFPHSPRFRLPCHSLTYTARLSVCNLQAPDNNAGLQAASVAV